MTGPAAPPPERARVIGLQGSALDLLMPMHIWVSAGGQIVRVGPTLAKLLGDWPVLGRDLFSVIDIKRPRRLGHIAALALQQGARLKLELRAEPGLALTALVVALPAGNGLFLNLSPGAALLQVLARFDLTLADFAATDLTAEMLFVVEARAAAFRESRRLTARLAGAKRTAEEEALTDPLTGLGNRRAMDRALAAAAADPGPQGFGLMHVDLDYFKAVNDSLGHAAGDYVLAHVADILREELRRDDEVARVGGDEFVLLLKGCNDLGLLDRIAQRIITRLETPILFEGQTCHVSASIGTAVSSDYDPLQVEQVLGDADRATYASKKRGRGCHTVWGHDLPPATRPGPGETAH